MLKKVSGIAVLLQLVSGELFFLTFGFLLFFFPKFGFNVSPEYFGTLILIMVLSQIILGISVWSHFKRRSWTDNIKGDLWERLFSFAWLNYWFAMFTVTYYLIILKDNSESNWWNGKRKKSWLFKIITKRRILDFLSKVSVLQVPLFLAVLFLGIIGIMVEIRPFDIFLIAMKLGAIWMTVVINLAGLFQFLMLFHMVSRVWTDYSFEEFFTAKMLFLPGIELRDYYYKIVRGELDE